MKIIFILAHTLLTLLLYAFGALVFGSALVPSFLLVRHTWLATGGCCPYSQVFWTSLSVAAGFFLFGITLMFLIGILSLGFGLRLREGDYPMGHPETLKWFLVNALFLGLRATFMDFMLLTPLCSLFYRMMGAKLGLGVQINSKNVADLSLLSVGDNTVIGGNATVIGHVFERRGMRLKRVKIGKNVVIGLNSVIMPGVEIGDGAVVAAGVIVPKGTVIPPKTIYLGRDHERARAQAQASEQDPGQ